MLPQRDMWQSYVYITCYNIPHKKPLCPLKLCETTDPFSFRFFLHFRKGIASAARSYRGVLYATNRNYGTIE